MLANSGGRVAKVDGAEHVYPASKKTIRGSEEDFKGRSSTVYPVLRSFEKYRSNADHWAVASSALLSPPLEPIQVIATDVGR